MQRSLVARLLIGSSTVLLAASLAGCGGSSTTSTSATTAGSPSSAGAPTSSAAAASSGSPTTTRAAGAGAGSSGATTYPGGVATVQIDAVSDVLNWSGTLTGTCAENKFAKFPVDIRAKDAAGVTFESHPSLPGRGTFEKNDPNSVPRMEGTLITFPAAASTATTRYAVPAKTESVSDSSDYTITFDNDEATSGTQVLKRFRFPTTKVNTGTITVKWTCA